MALGLMLLERMFFGEVEKRIKVEQYNDLIRSVGSTKRIENLNLCNTIQAMKEYLLEEKGDSFSYIATKDNVADFLTKPKIETQEFASVFLHGIFEKGVKKVSVGLIKRQHGWEIRMKKVDGGQE